IIDIGTLDRYEAVTATIDFTSPFTTPIAFQFPITARWLDGRDGNPVSQTKTVAIIANGLTTYLPLIAMK
ncbi:MAG: hypothetical protein D6706_02315, partial [Chloroflexi bacterium]